MLFSDPLNYVLVGHQYIMDLQDPRVSSWPMMSSPVPTVILCLIYVMSVKVWGPNYMKNRPPYQIKTILIVYNFTQVLVSTLLFRECIKGGWFSTYSFRCQPVDYSDNPAALRAARAIWWGYLSRFFEFFDTFFFVLRKKQEHVSLLHVVHHGLIPITAWIFLSYFPGGHASFSGLLNSFVHIVMYTYYLLAALGPKYSKIFAPWKKYLTTLQLVQFVAIFFHAFQLFFIECDYPIAFAWWICSHAALFFFLFLHFYWKSYLLSSANKRLSITKNE